jgi:tRNA 2-selenouridine synthase
MLHDVPLSHRLILLDGYTGTAKTALLPRLAARGLQTLDLEGLACHRGSLLGDMPGGQPSQKMFETALAVALQNLDPERPVIVEAESSKIGRLNLPKSLWQAMLAAPRIVLDIPAQARAVYLAAAYREVISDAERLSQRLGPLRRLRGHAVVDRWISLSKEGALVDLSHALMVEHYDPAYAKSRRIDEREVIATLGTDALDADGQERLADAIADAIKLR